MKIYNVFKRLNKSTEKTLVGTFSANSKKEICSKVASVNNGFFISAKEVLNLESEGVIFETLHKNLIQFQKIVKNTQMNDFCNSEELYQICEDNGKIRKVALIGLFNMIKYS
jgi:hypothetical protein